MSDPKFDFDPKSFMLQIAGTPDIDAISRTPYDLIILVAGTAPLLGMTIDHAGLVTDGSVGPSLAQIAALQAEGRTVLGYVNLSVTDSNRVWWDASWTVNWPAAAERDQGDPTDAAPAWLTNSRLMASDATQTFGPIAAFGEPDARPVVDGVIDTSNWWDIVAEQAVALVRAGYDGVFLDDVLRYARDFFGDRAVLMTEQELRASADQMLALIDFGAAAVPLEQADAVIVLNGGAYLGDNDTGASVFAAMAAQIDGILLEGATTQAAAFQRISDVFGLDTWRLGIDTVTNYGTHPSFRMDADADGILTMEQPVTGYDDIPVPGIGGTGPEDNSGDDIIVGTTEAEILRGGDGEDRFDGLDGDDFIFGGDDDDVLTGGDGDDILVGGAGDDQIDGGEGDDIIFLGDFDQDLYDWWISMQ